ncbi:MAG: hypothetical protein HY682_12305 [Chloroflexi bacterium]|nr:hypothetical protein [Chloroflexota bacterium]
MSIRGAIDSGLDRVSPHRLTLLALLGIVLWAATLSMFGVLRYAWWDILGAAVLAIVVAIGANFALARLLRATTDPQSSLITALILVLLVPVGLRGYWAFLAAAAGVAIASKYAVTVDRQHIFNPAALAVAAIPMLFPELHATWWVGTAVMLPAVVALGLLIVIKTRRAGVVLTFLATYLLVAGAAAAWDTRDAAETFRMLRTSVLSTALLFFAFVMMTDPITVPSSRGARLGYAGLVAVLYATPNLRFLSLVATPEVALCIGNAISFVARPRYRLLLSLKRRSKVGPDTWTFEFAMPAQRFAFASGQYLEWTFRHRNADGRGQRRYFTIASSPTEKDLRIVMRVPDSPSSYKAALVKASEGTELVASRLAGDFVLPRDLGQRLAFLAGGVGVAPFRSMAQYIVDGSRRCDIVLLYCCRRPDEFLFGDTFQRAGRLGMRTVYVLSNHARAPAGWAGWLGGFTAEAIRAEIPDFRRRTFYLSGSHGMVDGTRSVLRALAVARSRIRTDYFDGAVDG